MSRKSNRIGLAELDDLSVLDVTLSTRARIKIDILELQIGLDS